MRLCIQHLQDEAEYEEPPILPPSSDDFLDADAPPLPERSAEVDEDEGDYEELAEVPPPPPAQTGLCSNLLQFEVIFTSASLVNECCFPQMMTMKT